MFDSRMKNLLLDMAVALEENHRKAMSKLKEYAQEYVEEVCPYKIGDKIEAFSLTGHRREFVVQRVEVNDEEPLSVILDPSEDHTVWKVIAVTGDASGEPEASQLCYLYGSNSHELENVKKL